MLAVLCASLVVTACSSPSRSLGPSASSTAGGGVGLTIAGAASLTGVLERLAFAYETAVPRTALTTTTDSSAALRTQIEQGAPVDVFLSADTTNPAALVAAGLADGNAVDFATNQLAIIVPTGNPAAIVSPADLARPGVKIIAAGAGVPITEYAAQVLSRLAAQPGYPVDFAAAYAANVVSREDNVKAVVAKLELGEGDAGIVYETDARASSKVATVDLPADVNVPATDAGVVIGSSHQLVAGHAFLDWMIGPDAQEILATFGFGPPPA
jgi:molybdate transport system substrate-binding protein